MTIEVRELTAKDHSWAMQIVSEHWGSTLIITRGRSHAVEENPGWVAWQNSERVGVLHYGYEAGACEIVSLISLRQGHGVGTSLLQKAIENAQAAGMTRIWLVTTNDNLPALEFYQHRGFRLCGLDPGAVDRVRALKSGIPRYGHSGISIRDELELELSWPTEADSSLARSEG